MAFTSVMGPIDDVNEKWIERASAGTRNDLPRPYITVGKPILTLIADFRAKIRRPTPTIRLVSSPTASVVSLPTAVGRPSSISSASEIAVSGGIPSETTPWRSPAKGITLVTKYSVFGVGWTLGTSVFTVSPK